jgi:hypothetical protein
MFFIQLLKGIEHRGNSLTILVSSVQKVNDLTDGGILNDNHVFGHALKQAQYTPFGIKPCVSVKLFRNGLKRLNDPTHTKVIVSLGTIQRTNDQVNDA